MRTSLIALLALCAPLTAAEIRVTTAKELKAAMLSAGPGDAVLVMNDLDGVVNFRFGHSGEPGRPITLASADPAHPVALSRGGQASSQSVIVLDTPGSGHYVIRDLTIRYAAFGILIAPQVLPRVHDVRLERLKLVEHSKSGVRVGGYGSERLYITDCTVAGFYETEGGIDLRVNKNDFACGAGARDTIIRRCHIEHGPQQQASAIIAQESTENVMILECASRHIGQQGFVVKSGGWNLLANNYVYDQSKAGFYLRGPEKTFKDAGEVIGEIGGCAKANHVAINNVVIGAWELSGGGGVILCYEIAHQWMYGNTLVGLTNPEQDGVYGAPFTVVSGGPDRVQFHAKNNVAVMGTGKNCVYLGLAKNTTQPLLNRDYSGRHNLFWVADKPDGANAFRAPRMNPAATDLDTFRERVNSEFSSIYADPRFANLDPLNDRVPHDLRPLPASPAVGAGEPYTEDPDDYPSKVAELLVAWEHLADWTLLSADERAELLAWIETAHLRDQTGRPRDPERPTIGALEPAAPASQPTTQPAVPVNADLDGDGDVDQDDFGLLQRCRSGADVPARDECLGVPPTSTGGEERP